MDGGSDEYEARHAELRSGDLAQLAMTQCHAREARIELHEAAAQRYGKTRHKESGERITKASLPLSESSTA